MSKSNGHIVVPESFPSILKTYVKDAVRTQPYDLLTWSAAYFRCIADDVQPPSKIRFEENTKQMIATRCLTKEYLKVLVKQIGRGFFVERFVLQARWKSLGLSQEDLLAFLNLCGMLKWDRIHWLELLSVMAASMCKDFQSSIDQICELLTEDAEGGSKSIPFWVFNTCYSFLAEFDCSSDGDSTIRKQQSIEPAQINAQIFRNQLLTEWKVCVKFSEVQETPPISSHFDRMKGSANFDEMIQALSEIQIDAPNKENDDDKKVKDIDAKWKYEIIRRIGAPWNWIYQFVDHYLPHSRSYNFHECQHKLFASESLENLELPNFTAFDMSGAGPAIPKEVTNEFLNFIKLMAHENDGMVSPKYFWEENCPRMC